MFIYFSGDPVRTSHKYLCFLLQKMGCKENMFRSSYYLCQASVAFIKQSCVFFVFFLLI